MWIMHAENEQGNTVIMRFENLTEAASSVDALMKSGYTRAYIIQSSEA